MLYWLLLWGNNANGVQNAEIQGQLNAIRNQMSDNQNSNLLMDAVKGNNNAITQLASNLNCDFNSLNNAICAVRSGIQDVAGKVGYSAERVINAANLGDLNIVQQQKYNDARLELSQVRQNQYLISQLKPTTTTTA